MHDIVKLALYDMAIEKRLCAPTSPLTSCRRIYAGLTTLRNRSFLSCPLLVSTVRDIVGSLQSSTERFAPSFSHPHGAL